MEEVLGCLYSKELFSTTLGTHVYETFIAIANSLNVNRELFSNVFDFYGGSYAARSNILIFDSREVDCLK